MSTRVISRLTGVYDADGGLGGELRYVVRRLTGRGHCSLCDLTHRGRRQREDWRRWNTSVAVTFELVHRNERSEPVLAASEEDVPCVLGHVGGEVVLLLGPDDLDECDGDVAAFEARLKEAVERVGASLP